MSSDPSSYRQPVVLITGASGSIGQQTIASVVARGVDVVTIDRDPLPPDIKKLVRKHFLLDLLDDSSVETAVSSITEFGMLTHVVVIAGGGDLEEISLSDPASESLEIFSRVVENNLFTAFITIRHSIPALRRSSGDRSITLVSSINAFGGYGAPGYSAAKAGIIGLVNSLSNPLGTEHIRINCLALGTVDTENLRRLAHGRGDAEYINYLVDHAPLRRALSAREVGVALTTAAFDMPGLTGSTIVLDNGQTRIRLWQ